MTTPASPTMKVEIWSDIMCPFCYIGKRHYEAALAGFLQADRLEVEWKSFQLDPTIPETMTEKVNVYKYLADRKGMSVEQSKRMHEGVVAMAREAGLEYNFDKAVVANSFNAHRLIQKAKMKGLGDTAEELLFKAYFTEGKDFGEIPVLMEIGKAAGLTEAEVQDALSNDEYAYRVTQDVQEAQSLGVQGVPFFVFNRRYGISGAQPVEVFADTLQKSFGEWEKANPVISMTTDEGATCSPDGECF